MPILLNNGIDKNVATFDLRSPEAIAKMNGTITGSPTFDRDGCKLDGTNDEITFNLSNTLLSMPKLSISVDFIPEFSLDDGNAYYIYDTNSASRCYLLKNNVGNFQIGWNGVNLTTISKATYSPYWKENEMNKLLISTENGLLKVYLNDNLIANSSPTWTPASPTTLYVGKSNADIYHFKGIIKSISFKNDLSTENEVSDLYDNSTFNFQDKADIWLDMKSQYGKASGTELLTDGDMEASGTSAWTPVTATLTKETANPYEGTQNLKIAYNGAGAALAGQAILAYGERYHITGKARSDGSVIPAIRIPSGTDVWSGTTSTSWQDIDVVVTVGGGTIYLGNSVSSGISAGQYVEFDDVSVKEVYQYTKDKSGQGNDFKLGDGTTTSTFPTFKNPGMDFDGSNDYMLNSNMSGVLNNDNQTFVLAFKPNFSPTSSTQHFLMDTDDTSLSCSMLFQTTNMLYVYLGTSGFSSTDNTKYKDYWNMNGVNVLVVTADLTTRNIYFNGRLIDSISIPMTPVDNSGLHLGIRVNKTGSFDGVIYHFSTYGKQFAQKMSPTQVRAITSQLFNQYS